MPISGGKYVSPTWVNGTTPAINATEMQAITDTLANLPVANGGTGASTVAGARANLGLGNTSGAIPVANGGTGATTAEDARTNLGIVGATWYGTSSTVNTDSAKVVTCSGFALSKGAIITVKFANQELNRLALTLNVNDTGAKSVYVNGTITSSSYGLLWTAGEELTFIYDGTAFHLIARSNVVPKSGGTFSGIVDFSSSVGFNGNVEFESGVDFYNGFSVGVVDNHTLIATLSGVEVENLLIDSYAAGTIIPIANGGTGATNAESARAKLGVTAVRKQAQGIVTNEFYFTAGNNWAILSMGNIISGAVVINVNSATADTDLYVTAFMRRDLQQNYTVLFNRALTSSDSPTIDITYIV